MDYAIEVLKQELTNKNLEFKDLEDAKKPISLKLRLQIENLKRALEMITE